MENTGEPHPLFIELILCKLFEYLDVDSLKCSRLVCKIWEEVSTQELAWKGTVCISDHQAINRNAGLKEVMECFSDRVKWPFKKFWLEGAFFKHNLDTFLESRQNITKLTLSDFDAVNKYGFVENWTWRHKYHLNHFEYTYDFHHRRFGNNGREAHVTILMSCFRTTAKISLRVGGNCNIVFDEKISPTCFFLGGEFPKFFATDGNKTIHLQTFVVNQFLDLSNTKKLELNFQDEEDRITVDLTLCHKLENLHVKGVSLTGWNDQLTLLRELLVASENFDASSIPVSVQRSLKKLDISDFSEADQILDLTEYAKLETLHVENYQIVGWNDNLILKKMVIIEVRVDVSLFPNSLEDLEIGNYEHEDIVTCSSAHVIFPKLKSLSYIGQVPIYAYCPTLTHLELGGCQLDLRHLAKTIEKIHFFDRVDFFGTLQIPKLKKVIVDIGLDSTMEWDSVDMIMDALPSAVIVVDAHFEKGIREIVMENVLGSIFRSVKKQMERGDIFVISQIRWTGSENMSAGQRRHLFKYCQLIEKVMHSCCEFENYSCASVTLEEFNCWL